MLYPTRRLATAAVRGAAAAVLLLAMVPAAAESPDPELTEREKLLVEKVTEAVLAALREPGALSDPIEAGIRDHIRRQREAQVEARRRQQEQMRALAKRVPPPDANDHRLGAADAPLTLIEYSDFECPYCKRFHPTAKALLEALPGRVNWVYRHFPLDFHNPGARTQAEASECVAELGGNEAFWRFTDTIYERTRSGGEGFPREALAPLAGEVGVDVQAFRTCMDSGRHRAAVDADLEGGLEAGIRGTPGIILLDNRTGEVEVIGGAVPLEELRRQVDRLLAAGDAAQPSASRRAAPGGGS